MTTYTKTKPQWDGTRLLRLRLSMGLTMHQLGERAKLSHDLISRYEHNLRSPGTESLYKLRAGLQCSWRELLGPDS